MVSIEKACHKDHACQINTSEDTEVEINTGPLARGQLISCWASRICFALARLASTILKLYFWVYMV